MNETHIRPATEADVPAIAAIYGEAVSNGTGSFELDPPTEADMAARFAAVTGAGFPWLVVEGENGVLGFAYAGRYHDRPGYRFTVQDAIYLAPRARGQGIGKRLLAALIAEAERRGYRQFVAVVGDSANLASIRLHAALGFTPMGKLAHVGWKHGRWLDIVFMQLTLGDGAAAPPDGPRP